jgi:hypothetical protein
MSGRNLGRRGDATHLETIQLDPYTLKRISIRRIKRNPFFDRILQSTKTESFHDGLRYALLILHLMNLAGIPQGTRIDNWMSWELRMQDWTLHFHRHENEVSRRKHL